MPTRDVRTPCDVPALTVPRPTSSSCLLQVDYIRGEYGKFTQVSLSNLKRRFAKLDLNGDAALNIFEFRHAVSGMATHLEAAQLSDGECDRFFEYLDAVHDGAVVWDEFQAIYLALNDPKKARALPADIRNACIKMQYASIPDPNKCVSMSVFWGRRVSPCGRLACACGRRTTPI